VLAHFPESLSAVAKRALEKLGVEVHLGARVSRCDPEGVSIANDRIEAHTIIWAAGVMASPAAKWLDAEKDPAGRVLVEADLTLPNHPDIFVIGDTALARGADGKPLPGIAPVAKQQGAYAARVIDARLHGKLAPKPFRYRHLGTMATIGRRSAVADFGKLRLSGVVAWLLWGLGSRLFSGRLSQPYRCDDGLALGIRDIWPWRATDYRPRQLKKGLAEFSAAELPRAQSAAAPAGNRQSPRDRPRSNL
jgi:NADH dehydrogenase